MTNLDLNARYQVEGWPGVAVRAHGRPKVWEPFTYLDLDDEGNEVELESDEGEWIEDLDSSQVIVVMIGDDYHHTVDIEDLILIDDLDYCAECGQIGCPHDGRER